MKKGKIVVIIGPTAVGKTKYAIHVAQKLDGEILSADSMQVYRHMNIGSAKPTEEELAMVRHHLIGEVDPQDEWTAAEYQKEAKRRIDQMFLRGKLPIICGGTGLYVNSLIYDMDFSTAKEDESLRNELQLLADSIGGQALHERLKKVDPTAAERIHPNNIKKMIRAIEVAETAGKGIPAFDGVFEKEGDYDCIMIGLNMNRQVLYNRIEQRVDAMIEAGLVDEVRMLLGQGLTEDDNSMKGIGYKELIGFLKSEYSLEEAVKRIKQNSRNYAKRQMTWFRRYKDIKWFDLTDVVNFEKSAEDITAYIREKLVES
ncbi:MAG: tRNA (adenosine(37)-N6)-dimethylallyltransferase MiaA [Clostridiales bacterium]|nr:tRNA (adenosine(37)-N6)-dimethylallyltransferase MiaA [Clostridiales bacterium]